MIKQRPKLEVVGSSVQVDEEYLDLNAAGLAATNLPAIKQLFGEPPGSELSPWQRARGFAEYMAHAIAGGDNTSPFFRGIPPGNVLENCSRRAATLGPLTRVRTSPGGLQYYDVDPTAAKLFLMDWYIHANSKAFGSTLGFKVYQPPEEYGLWLRALDFNLFAARVQEANFPWANKYAPSEGDILNMLVPLWSR